MNQSFVSRCQKLCDEYHFFRLRCQSNWNELLLSPSYIKISVQTRIFVWKWQKICDLLWNFFPVSKKLRAEPLICLTMSKNLWTDSNLCPRVPKISWRQSQVCLTMSKNLWGDSQVCHTLLKKIVAVITISSHDVNNFVSCLKVLPRSVNNYERAFETLFIV